MKACTACNETKPLSDFYKHPKTADGRAGVCKACHKARMIKRSRENPAVQEYDRQRAKLPHRRAKAATLVKRWREENPELYQAQNAINNGIRDGKLKRGDRCADCNGTKNVFGIPADLSKPLECVVWRCALCHHRGRSEAQPAGERATA